MMNEEESGGIPCPVCYSTETIQRRDTDELVCKACGAITSLSEALEKTSQ